MGWFGRSTRRPADVPAMRIDLVDETGRIIRNDKAGYISEKLGSALIKLELNPDTWIDELKGFRSVGYSAVGTVKQLKEYSAKAKTNSRGHEANNGQWEYA